MKIYFDGKIFCFLLFCWAMIIIATAGFESPWYHLFNGIFLLVIVFYLHISLKNVIIYYNVEEGED